MPEISKAAPIHSAELAQRFVQFVVMQTQNIYYVLGKIPTPDGRSMQPNLEAGKVFIDQLEMIEHKTQGNLSAKEAQILQEALKNVRLAFVEASGGTPASMMPSRSPNIPLEEFDEEEEEAPAPPPPAPPARPTKASPSAQTQVTPKELPKDVPAPQPAENKKKFTKNYG
jgi:hypothetical protein